MQNGLAKSLIGSLPAIVGAALLLALWQSLVTMFSIHPITLPPPQQVLEAANEERATLIQAFCTTGAAAMLGLLASLVCGCVIAISFSQSRWLRKAFYPYVIFLQTVPIVAIAPLLITWFDYGFHTVVLVATIISLFPIVSNTTAGLISVDENLKDLFQLSGATWWQKLMKLQIPHAVSHLVLGLRISAGLAVIGAIVGEFFVGSGASNYAGLGTVMTGWQNQAKTDAIIAAIFVSTLLGIVVLGSVNITARLFLNRWMETSNFENS